MLYFYHLICDIAPIRYMVFKTTELENLEMSIKFVKYRSICLTTKKPITSEKCSYIYAHQVDFFLA